MLVSALMPTCNRRAFIPRAIECFLTQDYPNSELIILDDGGSILDLIPNESRVRFFHELPIRNHGEKMNRCMELARGDIAIVFDDDDWYPSNRISRQVAPFADPNVLITGTSTLIYHTDKEAYLYQSPVNINWLGAIAFRRTAWEQNPFESVKAGADFVFQQKTGGKFDLHDPGLVIASIHGTNAFPKQITNHYTPIPFETIEILCRK